MNWINDKLGNVADIIDPHPSHRAPEIVTDGIPFLGIGDIDENGYIVNSSARKVSKSIFDEHQKRYNIDYNTLGFGRVATIGKVIKFNLQGGMFVVSPTMAIIQVKHINTSLLYYLLNSIATKSEVDKLLTGSTRSSLGIELLRNINIRYPSSKKEQTRIAQILSKADEAIAQTEALIAKYQRIKTGLMQDLLTKGIDENGNVRSKDTHEFVVKNGIEVPKEWEVEKIEDITEYIGSGVTPKGGSDVYEYSGVMLIRSQNVLVGKFNFEDVAYISDNINKTMKRSEIKDLDVLLNITGASIGRSHFIPLNFPPANVNQHVCVLRIKNKTIEKSFFLSLFLNSALGQTQIKKLLGSSNREGLNYSQIREIKIALPCISNNDEFERIYKVLFKIDNLIISKEKSLSKLHSLKTGLMQDLLSGKVRIKVAQ